MGWDSRIVTQGMTKNSSHLALEWSDGPEKGIVVSGAPCTLREYISLGQNLVGC